jgi:porphobilinogen synthase
MALAQAERRAHVLGPSGMMDGQVGVVRGRSTRPATRTSILAYAAKYASRVLRPVPRGRRVALQGDRRQYQQDPPNLREALREVDLDVAEGADMVMVKPALPYST